MSASPMSAPRLFEYDCQNSRSGPGAASTRVSIAASSMPYPRVDDAVEQVDDQVDADDDGCDQQDSALHDRIVARLHAMDQPVADARPGKNGFGEDCPGKQQSDLQADH